MDETIKKALIGALITLIIVVIVYPLVGIFVITTNTVIYDKFPEQFNLNPNSSQERLELRIRNNAPITLAPINPIYSLQCSIEDENDAYIYFINQAQLKRNFTDYSMNVGLITAGNFYEPTIYLVPDEGNLTLRLDVYLKFFVGFHAASNVYSIEYLGDYNYNITKIK